MYIQTYARTYAYTVRVHSDQAMQVHACTLTNGLEFPLGLFRWALGEADRQS